MKLLKAAPKTAQPVKTIETMFRITASNSQQLSDQADKKSSLMITVNSIIASVMVTYLSGTVSDVNLRTMPLIILLVVNILTIAFAILATRPRVPDGSFTREQVREKKANLLFFGNFYRMPFGEYCNGMQQVMHDKPFLYRSLLNDLFCQGVVLGRKYKMLKVAYNIFLWGMILAIASFIISLAMPAPQVAVIP